MAGDAATMESLPIPAHVPPELVVDFDFYAIPGIAEDAQRAWKDALPAQPIAYTPRHGGHWVFSRGEDIDRLLKDYELTTNSAILIPPPGGEVKVLPEQSDRPDHTFYRRSIAGFFTQDQINRREAEVRAVTVELVESFIARGECEFVSEFSNELPIIMFLKMMSLPIEDRGPLRDAAVATTRGSDAREKTEGYLALQDYIARRIAEREREPRDDVISHVAGFEADGRKMDYNEALGLCSALLLGGLDTLASLIGLIGRFLAENPDQRRYIRENPDKMQRIVQELTRRFAVVSVTRVSRADQEYQGVQFRKGDLFLLPTMMHSMDPELFENPFEVDFERKLQPNVTFGSGIHTCVGNILARLELRVFLEEWLTRIPEFRLKPGKAVVAASGPVASLHELWLEWPA